MVLLPPILSLFDRSDLVFGLPVAYIFLFGFWALVIFAIAWGARKAPAAKTEFNAQTNLPPLDKNGGN